MLQTEVANLPSPDGTLGALLRPHSPMKLLSTLILLVVLSAEISAAAEPQVLYSTRFKDTSIGRLPAGWTDLVNCRPSRNWAVDGKGVLRVILKEYVGDALEGDRKIRREYLASYGHRFNRGVLVYGGELADGADSGSLGDISISATIRKTPDDDVAAGLILRLKDVDNYYLARFRGADQLEILRVENGQAESLTLWPTRRRITDEDPWTFSFGASGGILTARLRDAQGVEQTRVDAKDETFTSGSVGLSLTTFAGAEDFRIIAAQPVKIVRTQQQIDEANAAAAARRQEMDYPVVTPAENPNSMNTPFERISDSYDVVVTGGGTGGFGAAMQAARMGAKVLLLEETDNIGGQMANAAVTSMDEGGFWGKNSVRERGLYREFHESAALHYYSILKDPFTAYHYNRQSEGGYEPRVARAILYALIQETRDRTVNGRPVVLDLTVRTKVTAVKRDGNTVKGVTISEWTESGPREKNVASKVLIDATEYGDVIPLTGARYRVGNSRSDALDLKAPLQAHTWVGLIREYPEGLPEGLTFASPPPLAEDMTRRFKGCRIYGANPYLDPDSKAEKKAGRGDKTRVWWVYTSWRGMPDSSSPSTGEVTEQRHTKCGLNGGNDYEVTAATMEDPEQRRRDELHGINKTLGIIWWFQEVLGVPWSVMDEEENATPFQIAMMRERGVREDLIPLAARLPQLPYARESRRIIGVQTLTADDIALRSRGDTASKHWASAVSINDYSIDLHGSRDAVETDLDRPDYFNMKGPFQVPFGAFIPEKIDGFLPAEKNFSQSRIVNGATRLQPSTMLNGQAAGAMAALAVKNGVQPRQLNIIDVQSALLASGDTLVPEWFSDVVWSTPLWQATQLLSLYGMMTRPGSISQTSMLGVERKWGVDEPLDPREAEATLKQMRKLVKEPSKIPAVSPGQTRGQFALRMAEVLRSHGSYVLSDPAPHAPPYALEDHLKTANARASKLEKKGAKKTSVTDDETMPDAP